MNYCNKHKLSHSTAVCPECAFLADQITVAFKETEPVLKEFKLIVAGGRDFANADLLARVLIAMADVEYADYKISIVSGMAKGADKLAYDFAKHHAIQCYEFPAEWSIGKRAGYMRNTKMGQFSDGLLAFSNGSHGTKHMIEYMKSLGKPVTVVNY